MFRLTQSFARARRAAIKSPAVLAARRTREIAHQRGRKGFAASAKASWRRCDTGSNHISAFGVWRGRARRAVARINRTGETRWHRLPSITRQVFSEKGAS